MKIWFSLFGFLLSVNHTYSQESGLSLKMTRIDQTEMVQCSGEVNLKGQQEPPWMDEKGRQKIIENTGVRRQRPPLTDEDFVLRCELTNISDKDITIESFLSFSTHGNTIQIESPDGKTSKIGFACFEPPPPNIIVAPQKTVCWNADMRTWYFFGKSSKETGIYKFYWIVNGIKSDPFVYKHVRKE